MLLICPLPAFSQHFIGKTMNEIKKALQKKAGKNLNPSATVHSTDTTITFTVKEEGKAADFSYVFDKNGKCLLEMVKAADDKSYQFYLNETLAEKDFEWKKINENQYVSKFSDFLMIELPGEILPNQFNVFRTEWSKEMYELVTGKKGN